LVERGEFVGLGADLGKIIAARRSETMIKEEKFPSRGDGQAKG
jgi:hypothetical protein